MAAILGNLERREQLVVMTNMLHKILASLKSKIEKQDVQA